MFVKSITTVTSFAESLFKKLVKTNADYNFSLGKERTTPMTSQHVSFETMEHNYLEIHVKNK